LRTYVRISVKCTHSACQKLCVHVCVIAVLLPAAGIEPTSRYQRTFLRQQTYTTRLSKYLLNSISTSTAEWWWEGWRRKNVLWCRDVGSIPAAGRRAAIIMWIWCFEYRPELYNEPFPRRLRLPRPTLPLEHVFVRIRSTHCSGAPESG